MSYGHRSAVRRRIRLSVEATHGMALHALAAGFWPRHGGASDQHQGMVRRLRDFGPPPIRREPSAPPWTTPARRTT